MLHEIKTKNFIVTEMDYPMKTFDELIKNIHMSNNIFEFITWKRVNVLYSLGLKFNVMLYNLQTIHERKQD